MKKLLALTMAILMVAGLFAGCGNAVDENTDYSVSVKGANIVAEAGSAGEELATGDEFFKEASFTPVDSMAKALMEVSAGTADHFAGRRESVRECFCRCSGTASLQLRIWAGTV